jgi:protein-S-isoprenylcysteine O-methyltransferase Ste14
MRSLEVMVPPPVVAAVAALAMWCVSLLAPPLKMPATLRLVACTAFAIVGLVFGIAGVVSFHRARTTVNPTKPEAASALVSSGIYRVTRNPMYVGLSFVLFAWAIFLSSAWALLGLLAFVLYIGRFQIAPEERALAKLFGSEYTAYRARVRRWL